jgi:mRNA deadenylase 3'-5' endonuclease subunit Ccr4
MFSAFCASCAILFLLYLLIFGFQIVTHFEFPRYIAFTMHLDKWSVHMHSRNRKGKMTYNLERKEYVRSGCMIFYVFNISMFSICANYSYALFRL